MNKCFNWPIGICSWSLHNDFAKINTVMKTYDFQHIHLDLTPACLDESSDYLQTVRQQNWSISSAMIGFAQEDYSTLETIRQTGGIVPDENWPQNYQLFTKAVEAAQKLNAPYLSTHIGFIDHANTADYQKLLDRVKAFADYAQNNQIILLMETGQESAENLAQFLQDLNHPAVQINFDPANMILYGKGDPCLSLEKLAPWVKHVHIKDALPASTPGQWGTEVPWTRGQVGGHNFLRKLKEINYNGALAVECEMAGPGHDVKAAFDNLIAFEG